MFELSADDQRKFEQYESILAQQGAAFSSAASSGRNAAAFSSSPIFAAIEDRLKRESLTKHRK